MPHLRFYLDPDVTASGVMFESPRNGDAGFDLRASKEVVVEPGEQIVVETGLRLAIPDGWVGIVRERSSTGLKRLYTHSGVIDSSYRGEIKILLSNDGREPYHVHRGDKVAQILVVPCLTECEAVFSEAELGGSLRGKEGFGSTGR